MQLNVHLRPGQRDRQGHTFQSWAKFHVEFYDDWRLLNEAARWWEERGVECEMGRLTKRAKP